MHSMEGYLSWVLSAEEDFIFSEQECSLFYIESICDAGIFDEEGIFYGINIYNESLVFIDRYNENKYKNANMCIFGTSGSGKSFFTKLQIIRYKLLNIEQLPLQ